MPRHLTKIGPIVLLAVGMLAGPLPAHEPSQDAAAEEPTEPWLEPYPVPADPELEEQIVEVQQALSAVNRQVVRRKDALEKTTDSATKTKLYDELELLRKERRSLEELLNDLIEEAKASERTAIDEALARARWLEQQQERWYQKEELLRDRQE